MRSFRYILAVSLSLLIVFAGVGVSIMHYCCPGCEGEPKCCVAGCEKCSATVYKVDLVKQSCGCSVSVPFAQILCYLSSDVKKNLSSVDSERVEIRDIPPNPVCTRYYLALYSVFLI